MLTCLCTGNVYQTKESNRVFWHDNFQWDFYFSVIRRVINLLVARGNFSNTWPILRCSDQSILDTLEYFFAQKRLCQWGHDRAGKTCQVKVTRAQNNGLALQKQIAKVERYETKLSVMAFIGVFDELMRTVVPVSLLFLLLGHFDLLH